MRIHARTVLAAVCAALCLFLTATAHADGPNDVPLEVGVLQHPAPMIAGGKAYLAYELWLTDFQRSGDIHLDKLEVSDGKRELASFGADQLKQMIRPVASESSDPIVLAPSESAVIYVWLEFASPAAVPARLDNRIAASRVDPHCLSHALEVPAIEVDRATPIVIGAPLRGARWVAFNGPANTSAHRRTFIVQSGRPWMAQRYALDLMQVDGEGRMFKGDAEKNASYYCYGADVLAVADGVVVSGKDGIPENVPNEKGERAVPMTLETLMGNYLVLDIGHGHYAGYAHLIPGSVTVKPGDKVHRGQVLGKLGNSGNSTAPHLHFQVTNGPRFVGSDGIPYAFDTFEVYPKPAADAGDHLTLDLSSPQTRHGELVLENALINFPK